MIDYKKLMQRSLLSAAALIASTPAAYALKITLPAETATYKPSNQPGYRLVQQNCLDCHAAQYVQFQPTSSRQYWDATVKKMKKVFGAQFADEDIGPMVDYLVKTYGAEPAAVKTGSTGTPQTTTPK
jgi:sulfite dehydrogenase